MISQFNHILQAFGANRVKLVEAFPGAIRFSIAGWAAFVVRQDGRLLDQTRVSYYGGYEETARSKRLHAISLGKKRDEEGRVG